MLTEKRINEIRAAIKYGDGLDGDAWDYALAKAIEAEVLQAQEPVAKVTVHYNYGTDYKALVEWLTDCRFAPDTLLFAAPQPPAPCPKCEEFALFPNVDALRQCMLDTADENDALQAKVAEQSAEIERLKVCVEDEREVRQRVERGAVAGRERQAERIAELERQVDDLEAELDDAEVPIWPEWAEQCLKIVRKHSEYDGFDDADGIDLPEELRELLAEYDTEFDRERAKLVAANGRITEQAALIEKCRVALEDSREDVSEVLESRKELAGYKRYDDKISELDGQLARHDEALAAIAAHKS